MRWKEHEDFVSSLLIVDETRLLSTAGDCTLCEYDLRSARPVRRSVEKEDELLCVQALRKGRKLVSGALNGTLLLFSTESLEDCSDRFPGHPAAVNCMLKVSLVLLSEDGVTWLGRREYGAHWLRGRTGQGHLGAPQ